MVGKWVPGTKANLHENIAKQKKEEFMADVELVAQESETALAILDEIDQMEKTFEEEYDKVYAKDKDANKDLNILALEELKQAKYFFAYLRTQEKLYNYDRKK